MHTNKGNLLEQHPWEFDNLIHWIYVFEGHPNMKQGLLFIWGNIHKDFFNIQNELK